MDCSIDKKVTIIIVFDDSYQPNMDENRGSETCRTTVMTQKNTHGDPLQKCVSV